MVTALEARPDVTDPQLLGAKQYLTFNLGDEVFALDIRAIREIIQFGAMTTVPLMPDFVRGVINLRGQVVPVIDLKVRIGKGRTEFAKKTCVVIFDGPVKGEQVEIGLLVDAVSEVVEISAHSIEPAPQFGAVIQRDLIRGMGKLNGRFVVLLETDNALDIEQMAQEAAAL